MIKFDLIMLGYRLSNLAIVQFQNSVYTLLEYKQTQSLLNYDDIIADFINRKVI